VTHRIILSFLALALVGAACGGSAEPEETTTTTIVTTTSSTSGATNTSTTPTTVVEESTTTVDGRPLNPLNGMPVDDPTLIDRKLIAVKIDNHLNARPQSGLQFADAMIELEVEGGLTRFIALFLESDTEWLGPMRSLRPTDSAVIAPLNGIIQMSGGQPWIQSLTLANDVALIGEVGAPVTSRSGDRNRPHNLYVNTAEIRIHVENRGLDQTPPQPIFSWGALNGKPVDTGEDVFFDWTDSIDVKWQWTGTEYIRFMGSNAHELQDEDEAIVGQISADTLVVLRTRRYRACPNRDGSCVPASDTLGSNDALIFAGGQVIEGTWSRDAITDWFVLTGGDGTVMSVPPGRIFIMLYPEHADIIW